MYSLLLLCVLAVMWASLRLHQDGWGSRISAVWIISSAAGFLTHHFFVFPWLAIVAYLLLTRGRFSRLNLAVCVFLTGALIPFWYVKVPLGVANWRAVYDVLKLAPPGFDRTMALLETPVRFFSGRSQLWRGDPRDPFNLLALVLFGVIAAIAVWRLRLQLFRGPQLLLWFVFGAACLGPLVCDFIQHTYTIGYPRYSIAALPSAYLLAGLGLALLERRIMLIGVALIVLTWLPDISSIYRRRSPLWPMREIAHAASADSNPSDLIFVHGFSYELLGIARYASGSAPLASWVGPPWSDRQPDSVYGLIAGRTRVVFVRDVAEPAPEETWLRENGVVTRDISMGWYRILDFRPINSKTF